MKEFSFTTILVLGGGACAAASVAAIMAAAVTADESTSVGSRTFCLLCPGGSGTRAGPPSDTGCGSNLYKLQTDFLDTTNLTGGAAAATAPSSGSPHNDLYSDLLRGSGGKSVISIPPFVGALGRALAQPFPIRCGSALRTGGGSGGDGSFSLPLGPRLP
eukprot:SAG31_NODE_8868_length_1370_cov_2.777341_1_plen_160_part_00